MPQPVRQLLAPHGGVLAPDAIRAFIHALREDGGFAGRRVLVIIPDDTRSGPMPLLFEALSEALGPPHSARLEFLVALGTHRPMAEDRMARHLGMDAATRAARFPAVVVHNHRWDLPGTLRSCGRISRDEIRTLSDGLLEDEVDVQLNALIDEFDDLLVVGPVFPHEVVGFSGGAKYFFPGISGGDVIDFTHWLGALHSIPRIIGVKDTPVRAVIHRAAGFITQRTRALKFVVTPAGVKGLFAGAVNDAWSAAADLSATVHIVRSPRRYHTILACAPPMYEDIWTAGKCMYKLMSVLEPGGRLIIFAPHITEISHSHGKELRRIGYHVLDYFTGQWERFSGESKCIMAHSVHVRGLGRFEDGVEKPDAEVILATGIPREACEQVSLGYIDPATINPADFAGLEHEGVLMVPKAGEYLYRLEE